ncbi:effector-associated domain 2-containing protein [Streptomyces smaragdinus]|nr:hypothetical protein [Streptomyces smaragdinus]
MFVEFMRRPEGRALVLDVLPAVFPWVRYLPASDVREFSVELVDALAASADLDNPAGLAQLVTAWRNTAEIHSDPDLHAALRTAHTGEDYGPVPDPGE